MARMAECWLLVVAATAPVGLACWLLARRRGVRVLPVIRGWRTPLTGLDVLFAFLLFAVGMDVLRALAVSLLEASGLFSALYGPPDPPRADASRHLVQMWGYLFAVATFLFALWLVKSFRYASTTSPRPSLTALLALAVGSWAVLSLVTLAIHFGVMAAFFGLGWPLEEHPLANSAAYRSLLDRCLLVGQACAAAPLIEEVMFRGVLLPWLLARRANVWPVFGAGLLLAAGMAVDAHGLGGLVRGPVLFAVALVAGWVGLSVVLRKKRKTIGAIYASATVFAVVHSAVWPSPIPLFVLGLGLGWLAVRMRGVLVPTLVHGLFNAVSVALVLRGS